MNSLKKQRKIAIAEFERRAGELLSLTPTGGDALNRFANDDQRRRAGVMLVRDINAWAERNNPRLTEKQGRRIQRLRESIGQGVFNLTPDTFDPGFKKGDRIRLKPREGAYPAGSVGTRTGTVTRAPQNIDDPVFIDYLNSGTLRRYEAEVIETVEQRNQRALASAARAQRRHERRKAFIESRRGVRGLVWVEGDTCYYEVWANGKRVFADNTGVGGFDKILALCSRKVCAAREVINAGHTLPAFDDLPVNRF